MCKLWIITPLLLLSLQLGAADNFSDFKAQYQQQFKAYSKEQNQAYQSFRRQYLAEYDAFRQQLMQHWSEPAQSSLQERVLYSNDLQTRIRIDDVAQTVTIEHLTNQLVNEQQILQTLSTDANIATEIQMAVPPSSVTDTQPTLISQAAISTQTNPLMEQIDNQYQQSLAALDNTNMDAPLADKEKQQLSVENEARKQQLQQQLSEVARNSPTYKRVQVQTLQLPDDYTYNKAKPFLDSYQIQVNHHGLSLALLLAITQTESGYDPQATSHVPAFGLMQVVPGSAGLDVAQKFFDTNTPPSADELYNPQTNIQYGAGYLALLWQQYLGDIVDLESRKYCVIAAYNTGAGNVARAFNSHGKRSLQTAVAVINQLTPQQVYERLQQHLPYDETKQYLKKVRKLDSRYQSSLTHWNL